MMDQQLRETQKVQSIKIKMASHSAQLREHYIIFWLESLNCQLVNHMKEWLSILILEYGFESTKNGKQLDWMKMSLSL